MTPAAAIGGGWCALAIVAGFGCGPDAGTGDAGSDGGLDAGADAGLDGGEDAGVEPRPYDAGFGDGGSFDYSSRCSGNFRAAWAAASGRLYLGESIKIARLDLDGGCVPGWFTVSPPSDLSGISGLATADGGVTLFATVLDGRTFRIADLGAFGAVSDRSWTPDSGPTALYTVAPLSRDRAFVGGHALTTSFYFAQLDGDGSALAQLLPGQTVAAPWVLASGAVSSSRAYFAGSNNTMFSWDGQAFAPISGPGPAGSNFAGLCAFGVDHVLAVDTAARVWRFSGKRLPDGCTTAELWVDLMSATSAPLRALQATAPDDVWVVGDNNNVLHFGE